MNTNFNSKFRSRIIILGVISLAICFVYIIFFIPDSEQANNPEVVLPPYGDIIIKVQDGMSLEPIEGAEVIIVETDGRYTTDEQGKTPKIRVPIIEDKNFTDILKKPWGEVTIIVNKPGYATYVLFYAQIWENETRQGPNVLLFKADESAAERPYIIVEGPQRIWVNELISKYVTD